MSKEVYIIGGGNSLSNFDFNKLKNKTTIISNKSIFDVPNPNYFITTDYTFLIYLKKKGLYTTWKNTKCRKIFVVNCIADFIQYKRNKIIDTRYNLQYDLKDFHQVIICKSAKSIGFNFKTFNSGYNSGFSSFQLAILLGYNPIYLLGMDMVSVNQNTHYHAGYGRSVDKMNENLKNYLEHFLVVLKRLAIEKPELSIISCSPISLLNQVIKYEPIERSL